MSKRKSQVKIDHEMSIACQSCDNYQFLRRRLENNRRIFQETVNDMKVQDMVTINTARGCLMMIDKLLEAPDLLQKHMEDMSGNSIKMEIARKKQERKLMEINT